MRKGYSVIDTNMAAFLVQDGLKLGTDKNDYTIGICNKSGKGPIRASVDKNTGSIIQILCGAHGKCKEQCPFGDRVKIDQTDFELAANY